MVTIGKLENTLVGTIHVAANADGLVAVSLWDDESRFLAEVMRLVGKAPDVAAEPSVFVKTVLDELDAYFRGGLREFTVPIDWSVMQPFQQDALHLVCAVSYGHTTNYGTIADQLGRPGAARAVGRANATNPMPIIIPCHRILGADGKLHGYGARGGIETKAKLLRLEGSWLI